MAYTTIDKPTDHFSTTLYTGNNTYPRSLTGFGHQPDFVWFKHRGIAYWHQTYDSVRGTGTGGGVLYTNRQDAQDDTYKVNSFDSDGVTIPSALGAINDSGNVVGWSWKANGSSTSSNSDGDITSNISADTTAGFTVGKFTGTGSTSTVGTGLSDTDIVFLKNRGRASTNWVVYHKLIDGSYDYNYLNNNNAGANSSLTHTMTNTFKVGTNNDTNNSSDEYIFYAWQSIKGFSKFGKYTGNGDNDGPMIFTGFKPALVITKRFDGAGDLAMMDHKRPNEFNVVQNYLKAQEVDAEQTDDSFNIDIVSNGFKCRYNNGNYNASGGSYIYMAWAINPFVSSGGVPTVAR